MNASVTPLLIFGALAISMLSGCKVEEKDAAQERRSTMEGSTFMPSLPCGRDELERFVLLYASSERIRELFTINPIIVSHADLSAPPNVTKKTLHGASRLMLISEVIRPGYFAIEKVDSERVQVRERSDARYRHTFVNNGACWYYMELIDQSENACPGLSTEECTRVMEPDDEGIDPN